jgi:hypothetical protein
LLRRSTLLCVCIASFFAATPSGRAAPKKSRFVHVPPSEQAVLTPIPLWVETSDPAITRVVVRYRGFGITDWTTLELVRSGSGWAGEIPCRDVGTVTGVLRYYVNAYNEDGELTAWQGSTGKPIRVRIRRTIKSAPPHLPDKPPPARCTDPSDCPPGFPGCKARAVAEAGCASDDDCEEGMTCGAAQKCEPPPDKRRKNWLTLGVVQDVLVLTGSDFCTSSQQDTRAYSCLRQSDGATYFGTPLADPSGSRFTGASTTRIFLGYDRFVTENLFLGLRLGYVVRGAAPAIEYRTRSLPILAEARIGLWFGGDKPVRPLLFLSGGYAPYDFKFQTTVREDASAPVVQANPPSQTLDVYTTSGPWFAQLGVGAMFATSEATGFLLEIGVGRTFPNASTVIRPALSFAVGF